jgi:hypothetical protein
LFCVEYVAAAIVVVAFCFTIATETMYVVQGTWLVRVNRVIDVLFRLVVILNGKKNTYQELVDVDGALS